MPVTPPANRDQSAAKFAVRRRRRRAVKSQLPTSMPCRVRFMFKRSASLTLRRGGLCEDGVEAVEVLDEDGNGHGVRGKPSSVDQA
jgi:hypothetical protein